MKLRHLAELALIGLASNCSSENENSSPTREQIRVVTANAGHTTHSHIEVRANNPSAATQISQRPVRSPSMRENSDVENPDTHEIQLTDRTLPIETATGHFPRARRAFAALFTHSTPKHQRAAGLVDVEQGFKLCRTMHMSDRIADTQAWWNTARRQIPRNVCSYTLRSRHEAPLAVTVLPENGFTSVYGNATAVIRTGNDRIRKIDYVRTAFRTAFAHTNLYRFLLAERGRTLTDYFINVIVAGIPAQESAWGPGESSNAHAQGMWQMISLPGRSDDPLDGVAQHTAFHQVFGTQTTRADINPSNIIDATRAAALHFDNIFAYFKQRFGTDHFIFRNHRDVLLPALIGAYHHGQGLEAEMLAWSSARQDIREILSDNNNTIVRDDLYLKMSEDFYLANRDPNYGSISVRYVPMVMTWHWLIATKESHPEIDIEKFAELAQRYPRVPTKYIIAALDSSTAIEYEEPGRSPLASLTVSLDTAAYQFMAPGNHSQDQSVVNVWLRAHDPMGQRYQRGLQDNIMLRRTINAETSRRWLFNAHTTPRLAAVFNTTPGSGVTEQWRQVVRTDQTPTLNEIAIALNEEFYRAGMPEDFFIVPQINGGVRSITHNRRLGGSSSSSAHLGFSAFDFNVHAYEVHHIDENGNIHRYSSSTNLPTFMNALSKVLTTLSREHKLFIRYHRAHCHVVPMTESQASTTEEQQHVARGRTRHR